MRISFNGWRNVDVINFSNIDENENDYVLKEVKQLCNKLCFTIIFLKELLTESRKQL